MKLTLRYGREGLLHTTLLQEMMQVLQKCEVMVIAEGVTPETLPVAATT